ncbi:MAG: TonB-dependent receptor [Acidobacteria bacterium]|nr:TonB-dependent receptor [Acidobacteriota bacterium]
MSFSEAPKLFLRTVLVTLTIVSAVFVSASETRAAAVIVENKGLLGIIKGSVRDEAGNPIADAYVSFFRVGTSQLLKQVRSTASGNFLAKVLPGTYTVLAVAQGFNPVTYQSVEVSRSTELNYRFNLERAGSGNTLPEKRPDRNSSKWRITAAGIRASIYQNNEGRTPVADTEAKTDAPALENAPGETNFVSDDAEKIKRKSQTVVETFVAGSDGETYTGANFATLLPVNENTEVILAGQAATNPDAPQRFETKLTFRPNSRHQLRVNAAVARLGKVETEKSRKPLGQFSVQALDEWKLNNGVVFVFGLDYSRLMGAGGDSSITPRLGLQFDLNSKTRLRTSYTTQTEEKNWSQAIDLENAQVAFREPVAVQDFVVENDKPRLNKSSRFEFGLERILDENSSVEANVFFDLTSGRGVGLINLPIDFLGAAGDKLVANQQGRAQGVRVVYSRRINDIFSASAGYAAGNGQKLSPQALTNPANVFENAYFQTFFSQFDAALRTGTQVKTVFRLSPQATVFAIDPFQGRMAIYDPGLSVVVTQSLPTLGLPIRAEAVIDARNLLDKQAGINTEEGSLKLSAQRRILRGGILVRF